MRESLRALITEAFGIVSDFVSFVRYIWRIMRCKHEWEFAEEEVMDRRAMVRRCPKCREAEYCARRSKMWLSLWETGRWPE